MFIQCGAASIQPNSFGWSRRRSKTEARECKVGCRQKSTNALDARQTSLFCPWTVKFVKYSVNSILMGLNFSSFGQSLFFPWLFLGYSRNSTLPLPSANPLWPIDCTVKSPSIERWVCMKMWSEPRYPGGHQHRWPHKYWTIPIASLRTNSFGTTPFHWLGCKITISGEWNHCTLQLLDSPHSWNCGFLSPALWTEPILLVL